jgi:DNA-binding MarR family transcriptional regulator
MSSVSSHGISTVFDDIRENMEPPVQIVMDSLRRIVRALRIASKKQEDEVGLRAAQVFVLKQLAAYEPLSVNELAARTYSDQSTVSVVINQLVKKKLVLRAVSPVDRRCRVLRLAPAGHHALKGRKLLIQERFAAALAEMPVRDQRKLAILMADLVRRAGLAGEPADFFFEQGPRER